MMAQYVLALESVSQVDVSRVGRKAATLGGLLNHGFPIPRGICVTIDAFRFAFAPFNPLIDVILRTHSPLTVASAQLASDDIANLLVDVALPHQIVAAISDILPVVCTAETPLAVRSSATDEDGHDISFNGQYISFIGVRGEKAIHTALLTVWCLVLRWAGSSHVLICYDRYYLQVSCAV